jgi:uncharacterized membrane protein YhaH (DUF805 family)
MNWFLYSLRNYAKFEGRATRPEYWYFMLMTMLTFIILAVFDGILGRFDSSAGIGLLSGIYLVAVMIPSLAVGARRLHDTGRSGWWQLVNVVPYIGWVVVIVLFALRGHPESNRFGDVPSHDAG